MADARLGILISADVDQATAAFGKLGDSLSEVPKSVPSVVSSLGSVKDALDSLGKRGFISLGAVTDAMKNLRAVIANTTNTSDLAKLNQAYQQLADKARELKSVGTQNPLEGIVTGSQRAHSSLLRLSEQFDVIPRQVGTAAHSFDQLLQVYERLRAQSETSGQALSRLAAIFTGPEGIVLGVSLAIGFFSQFASSLFGTSQAFSELDINAAKFTNELNNISKAADDLKGKLDFESAVAKLNNQLKGLSGTDLAIANTNVDISQSQKLVFSSNVDLDKITKTKDIFDKVAESIRNQARAAQEAGLPLTKFAQLLVSFQDVREAPKGFIEKLSDNEKLALNSYIEVLDAFDKANKRSTEASQNFTKQATEAEVERQRKIKEAHDKQVADGEKFVNDTISKGKELASFFEGLRVVPTFNVFDTVSEQFAKARKLITDFGAGTLAPIFKQEIKFEPEFAFQEGFEAQAKKDLKNQIIPAIKNLADDTQKNIDAFNKLKFTLNLNLSPQIASERFEASELQKIASEIVKLGGTLPAIDLTQPVNVNLKILTNTLDQAKAFEEIAKQIAGLAVDSFANIGESIGTALAGGDLGAGFKQFASIIGDGLEAIGKQMIAAAPIIAALKKAIHTLNPAILLPVGIALVAIGAALKASVGNGIKGFAEGGRPEVGKAAITAERGQEWFIPDSPSSKPILLGEKGPEMFTPREPGKIVPNYQFQSFKKVFENSKITEASKALESHFTSSKIDGKTDIASVINEKNAEFKKLSFIESSKDATSKSNELNISNILTDNTSKNELNVSNVTDKAFTKESNLFNLISDRVSAFRTTLSKRTDDVHNKFTTSKHVSVNEVNQNDLQASHISDSASKVSSLENEIFSKKTDAKNQFNLSDIFKEKLSVLKNVFSKSISLFDNTSREKEAFEKVSDISKYSSVLNESSSRAHHFSLSDIIKEKLSVLKNIFSKTTDTSKELSQFSSRQNTIDHQSDLQSSINSTKDSSIVERLVSKQTDSAKSQLNLSDIIKEKATVLRNIFSKSVNLTNKISLIGADGPQFFKPTTPGVIVPNEKIKSFFSKSMISTQLTKLAQLFGIPQREDGGNVFSGIPFLGGENGAELFIPKRPQLSKSDLSGLSDSFIHRIVVEVSGRIAGNDILLSNARQNKSNNNLK